MQVNISFYPGQQYFILEKKNSLHAYIWNVLMVAKKLGLHLFSNISPIGTLVW